MELGTTSGQTGHTQVQGRDSWSGTTLYNSTSWELSGCKACLQKKRVYPISGVCGSGGQQVECE